MRSFNSKSQGVPVAGEFCSNLNDLWRAADCWWFLQFFHCLIPLTLEGISFRNTLWKYFKLCEVIVCTSCVLCVSMFRSGESLYVALTLLLIKLKEHVFYMEIKYFLGFYKMLKNFFLFLISYVLAMNIFGAWVMESWSHRRFSILHLRTLK